MSHSFIRPPCHFLSFAIATELSHALMVTTRAMKQKAGPSSEMDSDAVEASNSSCTEPTNTCQKATMKKERRGSIDLSNLKTCMTQRQLRRQAFCARLQAVLPKITEEAPVEHDHGLPITLKRFRTKLVYKTNTAIYITRNVPPGQTLARRRYVVKQKLKPSFATTTAKRSLMTEHSSKHSVKNMVMVPVLVRKPRKRRETITVNLPIRAIGNNLSNVSTFKRKRPTDEVLCWDACPVAKKAKPNTDRQDVSIGPPNETSTTDAKETFAAASLQTYDGGTYILI